MLVYSLATQIELLIKKPQHPKGPFQGTRWSWSWIHPEWCLVAENPIAEDLQKIPTEAAVLIVDANVYTYQNTIVVATEPNMLVTPQEWASWSQPEKCIFLFFSILTNLLKYTIHKLQTRAKFVVLEKTFLRDPILEEFYPLETIWALMMFFLTIKCVHFKTNLIIWKKTISPTISTCAVTILVADTNKNMKVIALGILFKRIVVMVTTILLN